MNTMIYEDLADPYCERSSMGFLDWKDTDAEKELTQMLWKQQGGQLDGFSDEWQDDVMPRIVAQRPLAFQSRNGSQSFSSQTESSRNAQQDASSTTLNNSDSSTNHQSIIRPGALVSAGELLMNASMVEHGSSGDSFANTSQLSGQDSSSTTTTSTIVEYQYPVTKALAQAHARSRSTNSSSSTSDDSERNTSLVADAGPLKEACFGGYEEETFAQHGHYEEVLWIDSDESNAASLKHDRNSSTVLDSYHRDVEALSSSPSKTASFAAAGSGDGTPINSSGGTNGTSPSPLETTMQKYFKHGFLPLDPEQSIRMQVLCALVDRFWETLCPLLLPLIPDFHKRRDSSGRSSNGGKFDSPRESVQSLNSSFNEDDFSTTASHTEIRYINQQQFDDDLSICSDLQRQEMEVKRQQHQERSFVMMRPEGVGQDQNIAFGLDHAIRIRPYTVNASRRSSGAGADWGAAVDGAATVTATQDNIPASSHQKRAVFHGQHFSHHHHHHNAPVPPYHRHTHSAQSTRGIKNSLRSRGEDDASSHRMLSRVSRTDPSATANIGLLGQSNKKHIPGAFSSSFKPKFQSIYRNQEFFSTTAASSKSSAAAAAGASSGTSSASNHTWTSTGSTTTNTAGTASKFNTFSRRPQTKRKKSRGKNPRKHHGATTSFSTTSRGKRKPASNTKLRHTPRSNSHFQTVGGGNFPHVLGSSAVTATKRRPMSVHGMNRFTEGSVGGATTGGNYLGFPARNVRARQQMLHQGQKLPRSRHSSLRDHNNRADANKGAAGLNLPLFGSRSGTQHSSSGGLPNILSKTGSRSRTESTPYRL